MALSVSEIPTLHIVYVLVSLSFGITILHLAYTRIAADYKCFLLLGPGAIPSTPYGYLKQLWLRRLILPDVLRPPSLPKLLWLQHGYLEALPLRRGPRPLVDGIAPHRQLNQKAPDHMYPALLKDIQELSEKFPQHTHLGRSTFEKHNTALFARYRTYTQPKYFGEIVHAHPSDGSMHMTLHPSDVKMVIERGWGERHPLAREGGGLMWCWWRLWAPVPSGFAMVYAPRDEKELSVVGEVIKAAMWWVGGVDARAGDGSWS